MLWVGVDVGGTFTDVVVFNGEKLIVSYGKVPSTPASPAEGVADALGTLNIEPTDVGRFVHGITNAILEQKGATVCTTEEILDTLKYISRNQAR